MANINQNQLNSLIKYPLFQGLTNHEIKSLLECVSANVKTFSKNEIIYHNADVIDSIGLVMQGSVHLVKEDFWGNNVIIEQIEPGFLFGESYAYVQPDIIEVSFIAAQQSDVLFIKTSKIIVTCVEGCSFHSKIIKNLFLMLSNKNKQLIRKINHLSKKTIKEKLMSYFSDFSLKTGSTEFEIPFNRQELADYLCVDRSALSNELSKLQIEGVILFKKNKFKIFKSNYID